MNLKVGSELGSYLRCLHTFVQIVILGTELMIIKIKINYEKGACG